jgi:cell division protein FtsL
MFALAAQVPGQKQAEDALTGLITQGALGSICVLLIVALVFAVRALLAEKDKRIADRDKFADSLSNLNTAAKELAGEALKTQKELQGVLAMQTATLSGVQIALTGNTAAVKGNTAAVSTNSQTITGLAKEVGKLEGSKEKKP